MRAPFDLDQLLVFATVVEKGSFSAAARTLCRAQSAVTYAVQELEADLQVPLFDRSGYRPVLNEAGKALLVRSRRVLREAGTLRAQAEGIAGGLEAELTLVVDAMVPMDRLTQALSAFHSAFPTVATRVHVKSLGAAADMVAEGQADLGLVVALLAAIETLEHRAAGSIDLVPVCAPGHPLAVEQRQNRHPLSREAVADHLQLVLTDRSPRTRADDHGIAAVSRWYLADLGAKHAMLRAGLGWGSLPRHMAAEDLANHRLVELRLTHWEGTGGLPRLDTVLVRRRDQVVRPAARWLFDRMATSDQFKRL